MDRGEIHGPNSDFIPYFCGVSLVWGWGQPWLQELEGRPWETMGDLCLLGPLRDLGREGKPLQISDLPAPSVPSKHQPCGLKAGDACSAVVRECPGPASRQLPASDDAGKRREIVSIDGRGPQGRGLSNSGGICGTGSRHLPGTGTAWCGSSRMHGGGRLLHCTWNAWGVNRLWCISQPPFTAYVCMCSLASTTCVSQIPASSGSTRPRRTRAKTTRLCLFARHAAASTDRPMTA